MFAGKRKTIGLFISRTGHHFENTVYASAQRYGRLHNFNVLIFNMLGYRASINHYDILEKQMFSFAPVEEMDGIIVAPDTYQMEGFQQELFNMLENRATCPVVSLRDNVTQYDRVNTDEHNAIRPLLRHLIEDHGYQRIHFLAGFKGHPDSESRLQCYIEEMESHDLPLPPNAYTYGTMWRSGGKEACDFFLQDGLPRPEAIVCANDYMAQAVSEELKRRGLVIPKDICVTGFDNILEQAATPVRMTTVEQDYDGMVRYAFERMDEQLRRLDEGLPLLPNISHKLPTKTVIRESCGCEMEEWRADQRARLIDNSQQMSAIRTRETSQMYFFIDINASATVEELHRTIIRKCPDTPQMRSFYLCLFENDEEHAAEDYAEQITDRVKLVSVFQNHEDKGMPMESFERSRLMPDWLWETEEPSIFFVRLLHQRNSIYGYSMIQYDEGEIPSLFYHHWNAIIASALRHMFYQQKLNRLYEERRLSSITDPLTKLNNRRGLEERIQPMWSEWCRKGESFAALSFDMDNLKPINDSYGHIAGDHALQTVAEALRLTEREGVVSARMGGDEFLQVLPGCDEQGAREALSRIQQTLEQLNRQNGTLYEATVSCGCYATTLSPGMTLDRFILESDELMYAAKRERKKGQKR